MATAQASTPTTQRRVTAAPTTNHQEWLGKITTKPKKRPSCLIVGGTFGIGKSSMAGNIPNAVAMPFLEENTWSALKQTGAVPESLAVMPPIGSWQETLAALAALREGEHNYQTLIVDTLGCAERYCQGVVCDRDYDGSRAKFGNYRNGFDASATEWRQLIAALDRLRDERNMSLMLLCHVKNANTPNPGGADYLKTVPAFDKFLWELTIGWCDAYLFADFDTVVVEEKDKTHKARGGTQRTFHTQNAAEFMAKNRLGLPATIDMGNSGAEAWNNLKIAMTEARKDGK